MTSNWTAAVGNRPAQLLEQARLGRPCVQDRQHAWTVIDNVIQCVMCHLSSEDNYASR